MPAPAPAPALDLLDPPQGVERIDKVALEQELRRIWLAAKTIASTKLPELAVVPELQEWRTTLDPRTAKLAKPGAELPPHDGLPPEPIGSRPRCVLVPPDPRPTRRERVARVRARKAARRRATR